MSGRPVPRGRAKWGQLPEMSDQGNENQYEDLRGRAVRIPEGAWFIPEAASDDNSWIGLEDLWRTLIAGWRLIIGLSLLVGVLTAVLAFLLTPTYRAQVIVAPVDQDESGLSLSGLGGQLSGFSGLLGAGGGGGVEESIATLKSRETTAEFIKAKDLMPVLFADLWNAGTKKWQVKNPSEIPNANDAYKLWNEEIRSAYEMEDTGLWIIAIDWTDPKLAAAWANDLVGRVNKRLQAKAIAESESRLSYLKTNLRTAELGALRDAASRLIEAEMQKVMMAKANEEYAFRVIDPAVVPNADDFESPKRLLMTALGIVLGGMMGVFIQIIGLVRRKNSPSEAGQGA